MITFNSGELFFTVGSYLVTVSVWSMCVVSAVAAFDLALRWLAYRRIESVAIHISSFMLVYSLVASLTAPWYSTVKLFISLGILVALIIAHIALREILEDQIDSELNTLAEGIGDGTIPAPDHRAVELAKRVARYVVAVALSRNRLGKLRRRQELVEFLQATGIDSGKILRAEATPENPDESFMIPAASKRWVSGLFSFLAAASVLVVLVDISAPLGPPYSASLRAQVQVVAEPEENILLGSSAIGVALPADDRYTAVGDNRAITVTRYPSKDERGSSLTVTLAPSHSEVAQFQGTWTNLATGGDMRITGEAIRLWRKEGDTLVYRVKGIDTCDHLSELSYSPAQSDVESSTTSLEFMCSRDDFIEIRVRFYE